MSHQRSVGKKRCAWLGVQPLPLDERLGAEQQLLERDRLGEEPREVDQATAPTTSR
ncbi:hypothetical protein LGN19_38440 [Burkholderia sp. AU30198]|uniref:hypothetical protein n=1 Tax=Burkholderia sp. AU30198 TaxID=2879627 RepID=UPI001CF40622|nr:hypothetical protein [Burkholderia sp. AU30198]MCA8299672.1 hypothetical protein [Burkholderia sp. AU30198]